MKSYRKELWFDVPTRRELINITPQVEACLRESGIKEGSRYVPGDNSSMRSAPQSIRYLLFTTVFLSVLKPDVQYITTNLAPSAVAKYDTFPNGIIIPFCKQLKN